MTSLVLSILLAHGASCPLAACRGSCQLAQDALEARAAGPLGKLAACPACVGKLEACPTLAAADPDAAVESGREALDHWWGYPWYDSRTDEVKRVDVEEPRAWSRRSGLFDGWDWSWLPFANGFGWPTTFLGWLAWIVIAAMLAGLVWVLYRVYRRWAEQFDTDDDDSFEEGDEDDARRVEALPFPVQRRQEDLLDEARRNYGQGNYGEGIIYLFSYELVELDKHRLIHLAKGKTNRQYLREIGRRTALAAIFQQTMVAFEDVFFGNRAIDRDRCDRCWLTLDRFQALVAQAAG